MHRPPSELQGAWAALQTVAFYVSKPQYLPEWVRSASRWLGLKLLPKPVGRGTRPANRWAESRALSVADALRRMTGPEEHPSLEQLFPAIMRQSVEGAASSTVEMGGGAVGDLLYHLAVAAKARRVVETGVAHGFSSLALLLAMQSTGGRVVSVDMPYPRLGSGRFVGCAVPQELRSRWTLIRYPDSMGLPRALRVFEGQIDLFHYDSDKGYEGRVAAFRAVWRALGKNGLLICDDIGDNTAFRDFAEHVGEEPIVVRSRGTGGSGERLVGVLKKSGASDPQGGTRAR